MKFIDYEPELDLEKIKKFIENNNDFYLFGADGEGEYCYRWLKEKKNKKIRGYIDNNKLKQGSYIEGVRVFSIDEVEKKGAKIIITSIHADEIANQLESLGYILGKDYIPYDNIYWIDEIQFHDSIGKSFYKTFKKYEKNYYKVINILSDDYSKEIYTRVINYRITSLNPIIRGKEYLPLPIEQHRLNALIRKENLKKLKINEKYPEYLKQLLTDSLLKKTYEYKGIEKEKNYKVIMDIGGYIGDTAVYFAYKYKDSVVYSFEPTIKGFNKIKCLTQFFNNIVPVKLGVGGMSGYYLFEENEKNLESSRFGIGNQLIEVTTLDKFTQQKDINKVDLIKMDIEGSELDALKGAKSVIERDKPDLAICIYHSPIDLWKIPLWIKENFPEYNIYVDHRDGMFVWGTVCFATIGKMEVK